MPAHEPKPGPPARPVLSLSQLVASALAAASAAFGASYLGVAGTIIGAAVASVIATVAGAMYSSSLQRTRAVMQTTVTQWSRTAATAPVVDPNAPERAAHHPVDHDPADTRELVIAPEPRRPLPWARISVAATAVLAVTLGTLTGVESILGKPLANVVGGSDATGTSLGSVGGPGGSGRPDTTVTKNEAPTDTTTPSAPATTPSGLPSGSATAPPTSTPTDAPTGPPTADPTAEPTGGATTDPASGPSASPTDPAGE